MLVPLPLSNQKRLNINKKLLQLFARFVVWSNLNVKVEVRGKTNSIPEKPVFIIANHQTLIDAPLTLMLNHRVVLITTDWLRSTRFRPLIDKYLEFISVNDGIDNGFARVTDAMSRGNSVLIFPEGTRHSGGMGRFHKGTFFMAEKLKADILPVVICGSSGIHGRKWYYLRRGRVIVKIGDLIRNDDSRFGTTYSERAKLTGRFFREEYAKLALEL